MFVDAAASRGTIGAGTGGGVEGLAPDLAARAEPGDVGLEVNAADPARPGDVDRGQRAAGDEPVDSARRHVQHRGYLSDALQQRHAG